MTNYRILRWTSQICTICIVHTLAHSVILDIIHIDTVSMVEVMDE